MASDGSDTPLELIEKAKKKGISLISVTDHDTLVGLNTAGVGDRYGITVVSGVEFSCRVYGEGGFDCHILGYGFDPENEDIKAALRHGREQRLAKLEARLKYLKERFGIEFSEEEIGELHSYNSVAKPHLARLIIKHGLADSVADAIDKYLKGEKFPDDRIDAKEAIEAIALAGGVSIYAHPLGGERETRLTREELMRRAIVLKQHGIRGMECYYSRYNADDEEFLSSFAKSQGLLVSGGSDYHGENKTVVLGTLSADGDEIAIDRLTVLSALGICI